MELSQGIKSYTFTIHTSRSESHKLQKNMSFLMLKTKLNGKKTVYKTHMKNSGLIA